MCLALRARTEIQQYHSEIAGIAQAAAIEIRGTARTQPKFQQCQTDIAAADNAITV